MVKPGRSEEVQQLTYDRRFEQRQREAKVQDPEAEKRAKENGEASGGGRLLTWREFVATLPPRDRNEAREAASASAG